MNLKRFYRKHQLPIFLGLCLLLTAGTCVAGYFKEKKSAYLVPLPETAVREAFANFHWQTDQTQRDILGATFRPLNFKTSLAERLTEGGSETTIDVTSVSTIDGHTLTMDDLGDIVFLLINPGASNWELVSCTGLTGTQFTGCTRGYVSYAKTTDSDRIKAHSPGETIIITNDDHYLSTQYAQLDEDSIFTGQPRFENASGIIVGAESTADSCLYFGNTNPTASSYICYDPTASTSGGIIYSYNGTDSYLLGAGDSSYTAGNGIDISASVISVLLATTTPALEFNNDGLRVLLDPYEQLLTLTSTGLLTNVSSTADELNLLAGIDTDLVTASSLEETLYYTFIAGEDIDAGLTSPTAVTLDDNGEIYKAKPGLASDSKGFIGFALSEASANASITVQHKGIVKGFTGLTAGDLYRLVYEAAGEISNATSTWNSGIIGRAVGENELDLDGWFAQNSRAGYGIIGEDNSEESGNDTNWTLTKTLTVYTNGIIRTSFELKIGTETGGQTAHAKIYINGTAIGTDRSNGQTTYKTFEEDFSVASGDQVQLYTYVSDAGNTYYVKNFKVMVENAATSTAS